jgi:hypothetical protein
MSVLVGVGTGVGEGDGAGERVGVGEGDGEGEGGGKSPSSQEQPGRERSVTNPRAKKTNHVFLDMLHSSFLVKRFLLLYPASETY